MRIGCKVSHMSSWPIFRVQNPSQALANLWKLQHPYRAAYNYAALSRLLVRAVATLIAALKRTSRKQCPSCLGQHQLSYRSSPPCAILSSATA